MATAAGDAPVSAQVQAARSTVLALRRIDLATLVVTGTDRVSWLNGMLTCELARMAPGDVAYGLAVARSGKVLSDATVVVTESAVLVVVPRAVIDVLRTHLEHHLVMEDAEMASDVDSVEAWMLHGPRASEVLAAARAAGAAGGTIDWTGLGGALVALPAIGAAEARVTLAESVRAVGGLVGDDEGWEALRLERAIPRFGADFDDKTYPQEARLEKTAVSFEKGCYLGQEVVCMLELRGRVKRKLASVILEAEPPPTRGTAVTDESGAAVGEVTSATMSPTLCKPVALAMLKSAQAQAGVRVIVGGARAQVVDVPA